MGIFCPSSNFLSPRPCVLDSALNPVPLSEKVMMVLLPVWRKRRSRVLALPCRMALLHNSLRVSGRASESACQAAGGGQVVRTTGRV